MDDPLEAARMSRIIELLGIALVAVGVGIHRPAQARDLPFLERT